MILRKLVRSSSIARYGVLFFGLLSLSLLPLFWSTLTRPSSTEAWYNSSWTYRKKITIPPTSVSGTSNLTNYPLLVSLTDADLSTYAQADADDIVFTDVNDAVLDYEIESYTSGTGALIAWVRIPTLSVSTSTVIYMYYGNGSATNQENAAGVWTDYQAVYHLDDATTDSAGNHTGTDSGTATGTGKIGNGRDFENSESDSISLGTWSVSASSVTLSGWVQVESFPGGVDMRLFSKSNSTAEQGHALMFGFTGTNFRTRLKTGTDDGAGTTTLVDSTGYSSGTWYYFSAVYNGSNIYLYRNGTQTNSVAKTGALRENTWSVRLGANGEGAGYFDGILDEMRVTSQARSAGWLLTEYNNQNSPSTFYTVGSATTEATTSEGTLELEFLFNEGFGTSVYDTSVNEYFGSISGALYDKQNCISGFCIAFDGVDDVVTMDNNATLSLSSNLSTAFTIATWIRPRSDGESDVGQIFNKGSTTYLRTTNQGADGLLDLEASLDLATSDATVTISDALSVNRWHHVAIAYTDDSDDEIIVYVDGKIVGTSTNGSGAPATDTNDLLIGGPTSANFDGYIDSFRIFSEELTLNELAPYSLDGGTTGFILGAQSDDKLFYQDLRGYWDLNEASGDALDQSGLSQTLTDTNTVTRDASKFSNGGDFESTNSEYLYMADNANLSITGDLTLSAWIKPESTTAATHFDIVGKWDGTNESYLLAQYGDEIRFYIDSASNYVETSAANLSTGVWYHILATYDATAQTATIYVNGAVSSSSVTGTIPSSIGDDAGRFHIGAEDSSTTAANFYDGEIDEVRIYSRVFTDSQALGLFDHGPKPFAFYSFDSQTRGPSIVDYSGSQNHTTMLNTTLTTNAHFAPGRFGAGLNTGSFSGIDLYSAGFADDFNEDEGTFGVWARVNNASSWTNGALGRIIYLAPSGGGNILVITKETANNTLGFQYVGNNNNSNNSYTISTTQWFYVTITWSKEQNEVKAFINGTNIFDLAYNEWLASFDTTQSSLGSDENQTLAWPGYLDQAVFYNYPRTPKQIRQDMNGSHPLGGSPIGSQTAYYTFDDGASTTVHNKIPSINSLHGTASGGAAWQTFKADVCKYKGCLYFDGVDDVVTVTNVNEIDFDLGLNVGFTFSAWVNVNTDGENSLGEIFDKGTNTYCRTDSESGTVVDLECQIDLATTDANLNISGALTKGTWHHVAVGYTDDADDEITIWIDGVNRGSSTNGVGSLAADANNLLIGGDSSNNYHGYIDEFRIYSDELSDTEIVSDMNLGRGLDLATNQDQEEILGNGAAGAPILYWNFDDHTETSTIYDRQVITGANDLTATSITTADYVPGKYGKALRLDGAADRLETSTSTGITQVTTGAVSVWFRRTASLAGEGLIFAGIQGSSSDRIRIGLTSSSEIFTRLGSSSNALTGVTAALDTWYHGLLTWDGTNFSFYLNGQLVSRSTYTGLSNVPSCIGIGSYSNCFDSRNSYAPVMVDEIKYWNEDLDQDQIMFEYNRGKPFAHYKFDECSGTTLYDSSVNGLDMTFTVGAAPGDTITSIGTCGSGDGSQAWHTGSLYKVFTTALALGGQDDYAQVADSTFFDNQIPEDLSISGWIYQINGSGTTDVIAAKKNSTSAADAGWMFYVDSSGYLNFIISDGTDQYSSTSNVSGSPVVMDTSGFSHVVAVWDRDSASNTGLYINGVKMSENSGTIANIDDTSNALNVRIGSESDGGNYFDGMIDDLQFYNYALSPDQIKQIMLQNSAYRFGPEVTAP